MTTPHQPFSQRVAGWADIDRSDDPQAYLRYLDNASAAGTTQAMKRYSYGLLEVQQGQHLLDVGCGLGGDVQALAQLVGPTGRVVGIDISETLIAEARQRATTWGLPVEFRVGDALHLDFPENTFDGCRAERTFQHVDDLGSALAEMVRVARPGAHILILDPDWGTATVNAPDRELTRRLWNFRAEQSRRAGWTGRELYGLFREGGLAHVTVTPVTDTFTEYRFASQIFRWDSLMEQAQVAGVVSTNEAAAWFRQLEEVDQAGRFLSTITMFMVCGRKP